MPFNPVYNAGDLEFVKETLAAALREQSLPYMAGREPEITVSVENMSGDVRKVSAYAKVDAPFLLSSPGFARIAAHIANRGMMAALIDSLPYDMVKDGLGRMASGEIEAILPDSDDPLFDNVAAYCEKVAEENGMSGKWSEMLADAMENGLSIEYGIYAEAILSPWAEKDEEIILSQGFAIDAPWFMRGESMENGLRSQRDWLFGYLKEKALSLA